MKRVIKAPRRDKPQQSIASEAKQRGVKPDQETKNEYRDDSSFNWEETDQHESSGPGGNRNEDSVLQITLELEDEPLAEENIGVDPYNKGRFDTGNK